MTLSFIFVAACLAVFTLQTGLQRTCQMRQLEQSSNLKPNQTQTTRWADCHSVLLWYNKNSASMSTANQLIFNIDRMKIQSHDHLDNETKACS